MTEALFSLVNTYGAWIVMVSCFLSCLMVPIPTSFLMLAGGAFCASGDLSLTQVFAGAYAGAVAGDQAGFFLGRRGETVLRRFTKDRPKRTALVNRARSVVDKYGEIGVFFSTWLVAPLGPWVNLMAGATGLSWRRFAVWDAFGEAIWVCLYIGLGYIFADRITDLSAALGNSVGFLAAGTVAVLLGLYLKDRLKALKNAASPLENADKSNI